MDAANAFLFENNGVLFMYGGLTQINPNRKLKNMSLKLLESPVETNELWQLNLNDFINVNWELVSGSPNTGPHPSMPVNADFDPNNFPGSKSGAAMWVINNLVIIFGGFGLDKNKNQGKLSQKIL